jgi:hypothetical protein
MIVMGMRNKEIVQAAPLQGCFHILYGGIRAKSHAAVKEGGVIFANKKISFACFVRDAVNISVHVNITLFL